MAAVGQVTPAAKPLFASGKMSGMDGRLLSETFVELADTMVVGFDVIDFLHVLTDRSVQPLGARR